MSLFKRIFSIIVASTFVLTTSIVSDVSVSAVEANLPDHIRMEKDNFDLLDEMTSKYQTKYIKQVNNNEERIQSLAVISEPFEVSGEMIIDIPPEIMKIAPFFYRFDLNGTGIKEFQVTAISPDKESDSKGWKGDNQVQIRVADSFNIIPGVYEGYQLKIEGTGSVKELVLFQQNGLPISYDITAYTVLGSDKEILDTKVTVDTTKRLSIEGITEYEEEKFKNVYAAAITADDGYVASEYYANKNFTPGRGMFKFKDALEDGNGATNVPLLAEDSSKPGYAEYSFFDETLSRNQVVIDKYDTYYKPEYAYVTCYDNWPTWNWREGATGDGNRGTPALDHFEAAADLAAHYAQAVETNTGGRGPTWIEVKNESTITSEWSYHSDHANSWSILSQFHNMVSDSVRSINPDALVGGPTAAWMAFDANDFAEGYNNLQFLDQTKGSLDFYSYHFYEGKDLILHETESNYSGYLTGRLEADLDLIRNHMNLTNNVKPIVISETGTLHSGSSDPDHFILLKNFNAYKIRYMNRANEFDIVVPFILPIMWWDRDDPNMIMSYNDDNTPGELNNSKYYIENWDEYNGKLVPTFADNDKVFTHSAQDGNVLYVAVNNMNPQRISLDLDLDIGDANITKIERNRTYLELGELYFVEETIDSLDNVPLAVEETSVFKITLDSVPEVSSTLYKQTDYATSTLKPTGSAATFRVKTKTDDLEMSTLRVSLGRNNGFKDDLTVTINGTKFTHDLAYTDKIDRYFGYVDFILPTNIVTDNNEVIVEVSDAGGMISTVALINHYNKGYDGDVVATLKEGSVNIDGVAVSYKEGYEISGDYYFNLDDLGKMFENSNSPFNLIWDENLNYYKVLKDTEFTKFETKNMKSGGNLRYMDGVTSTLYFGDDKVNFDAFEVQNEDYISLKDFSDALGVICEVDGTTINITT